MYTADSLLAGMVIMTGSPHEVAPRMSLIYGFISAIVFIFSSSLLERWRVDDPVHAVSVHGVNGFLCLILHGIFSSRTGLIETGSFK